jgi:hypothetical protein
MRLLWKFRIRIHVVPGEEAGRPPARAGARPPIPPDPAGRRPLENSAARPPWPPPRRRWLPAGGRARACRGGGDICAAGRAGRPAPVVALPPLPPGEIF